MDMASTIWREMYGNGAGTGMVAAITAVARQATRGGLLQALTVCCGAAAGTTAPTTCGALIATTARLAAAATITVSVACVLEVSQAGERSDKQARSGAAPVRREVRAEIPRGGLPLDNQLVATNSYTDRSRAM